MASRPLTVSPQQASRLLLAIQAADAVACAVPAPAIKADLDRLGCPPWLQRTIPVLKGASVAGLLAGHRDARRGRLTTNALVAYFICALGAHARVRDPAWRWAAAAGMLGLTLHARRAFADAEVIDLTTGGHTVDPTAPPDGTSADADGRPVPVEPAGA